ncbi:uncharacterized protein LOC120161068 [Hibiscus syriacus]|uniref:uncharacterized protein LOC120161068 n=1 Tax=Hibiscus syriacus TaxID=106335 RepID=UPI001923DD45|nr:uncharacterized protein LOC120161068 [Hibiscus syriacus]
MVLRVATRVRDGGKQSSILLERSPWATVTASYFLLTADYGPEPNVLDPIKNTILSVQSSVKEFIVGSRKEHQESSRTSDNAKEHP